MKLIYLNGQQEDPDVDHITFPTGEKHIRIRNVRKASDVTCGGQGLEDLTEEQHVAVVYNDPSGDVLKLGMAVDICRREGVKKLTLLMPFVPYARQDRVATPDDPFSIRVFSKFINSLEFDRVVITDPHSEVTPALLNNCFIIHQHEVACHAIEWLDDNVAISSPLAIVAPDLGSAKKTKKLQSYMSEMGYKIPVIQCDKSRDIVSGKITGFKILDGDPRGHYCLMVDDICDGGGTFLGLWDVLNEKGADGQSLYVTHGIFSKGTGLLLTKFDHLLCSYSFHGHKDVVYIRTNYKGIL